MTLTPLYPPNTDVHLSSRNCVCGYFLEPRRISVTIWIFLTAIWVIAHPWEGLRHDGVLYAAQAMLHQKTDVFENDLFFAYGSQDAYTVFGKLYAFVIDFLGLTMAARVLWGGSQVLWLLVAVAWLRRLLPTEHLLPAAAVVFMLPVFYSSDGALRFAESFLTARLLAEPLALAGVLAVIVGRSVLGALFLAASVIVHPIMALPALFVSGLWLLYERSHLFRPFHVLTGVIFCAAMLSVLVFFSPKMEQSWLQQVAERNPIVVAGEWRFGDWIRVLYPACVLALASLRMGSEWGRLCRVISVCSLFGLFLATVAWIYRWELGLQAQLWRFGWLAAWATPVVAVSAVSSACYSGSGFFVRRVVMAATIPVLVLQLQTWSDLPSLLSVVHLCLLAGLAGKVSAESMVLRRLAVAFLALATALSLLLGLLAVFILVFWDEGGRGVEKILPSRAVVIYLGWTISGALTWLIVSRINNLRSHFVGLGCAILAMSLAAWIVDSRSKRVIGLDRLIEDRISHWEAEIPTDASVYWPDNLPKVWFVLGRQSYASRAQLAGSVFSIDTSMMGQVRLQNVRFLGGRDAVTRFRNPEELAVVEKPRRSDLEQACKDVSLDFVVLELEFPPVAARPFFDPVLRNNYYLHRCSDFRRDG